MISHAESYPLTPKCLEYVLFCVEALAERLNLDPVEVYDLLRQKDNLLETYIIPCYEPLHTQGKEYIVTDILGVMREKGILV